MKKHKTIDERMLWVGVCSLMLGFSLGWSMGWLVLPHTETITNTIYQEPTKVIKVELGDGWKCEQPKMSTDLLQPTGYWIGDTISCWKLETPIDEYRLKQCLETEDDYWCDQLE